MLSGEEEKDLLWKLPEVRFKEFGRVGLAFGFGVKLVRGKCFQVMMHNSMMVGIFSHSTTGGKLRKNLPYVPLDARVNLPRYSLDETAVVCHYYHRQRLFPKESWKKTYHLSNGNGTEMRVLVLAPFY